MKKDVASSGGGLAHASARAQLRLSDGERQRQSSPPHLVAAGPTAPGPFRPSCCTMQEPVVPRVAASCGGGRARCLLAWRQVPRVACRACRHRRGGPFCQIYQQVVFFVNSFAQVVFFDKKSDA